MDALRSKVDERVVRLSDAISRDLTTPDVKKAQVQKSVKLLLRLGYGEQVIISHRYTFMHLDIKCHYSHTYYFHIQRHVGCFSVQGVRSSE